MNLIKKKYEIAPLKAKKWNDACNLNKRSSSLQTFLFCILISPLISLQFTKFCLSRIAFHFFKHLEAHQKGMVIQMKQTNVRKLALTALLIAVAVAGSVISFPIFASRCSPVQHMVNILCAVLLGPSYGLAAAFIASLLRNLLALGSLLAFPGSMFGALLCGLVYKYTKNIWATCAGEVFGTAILGGLAAYPFAIAFMGKAAGDVAFYAYVIPFLVSTAVGALLSALIITTLQRSGILSKIQSKLGN